MSLLNTPNTPRTKVALVSSFTMGFWAVLLLGVVVVLPAEAGEKHFGFEERVKLVNPRITAEGYKIGTRGFTNYLLHADDMIKE